MSQYTRSEITGYPNFHQVSDLGIVQFRYGYDEGLLAHILKSAMGIKESHAQMRQLNLNYIRDAASHIPAINDLLHSSERMKVAEELSGVILQLIIPIFLGKMTMLKMSKDDNYRPI